MLLSFDCCPSVSLRIFSSQQIHSYTRIYKYVYVYVYMYFPNKVIPARRVNMATCRFTRNYAGRCRRFCCVMKLRVCAFFHQPPRHCPPHTCCSPWPLTALRLRLALNLKNTMQCHAVLCCAMFDCAPTVFCNALLLLLLWRATAVFIAIVHKKVRNNNNWPLSGMPLRRKSQSF